VREKQIFLFLFRVLTLSFEILSLTLSLSLSLSHYHIYISSSPNAETRCRVCQATFTNLPRRSRRERLLEWFAPTAKDRTHQYFNAWRDALLNTLIPIAADADCREFNRLGDIVETILGCEVRVFYSREMQRGNKLFILLRKWFHRLEKTHVYTYIARTLGRMLIAGVSSVIDDDGTMVRTRHRVDAFVPFVTAIRDVLVCLQDILCDDSLPVFTYARREKLFSITTPLLPPCLFHFASSSSSSSSCFALFC